MDDFVPQTGGLEVREGHEASDLSIRGIVTFLALLAIGGALTFLAVRVLLTDKPVISLGWWESRLFHEPPPLTAAERELQAEREGRPSPNAEAGRTPEWYGRGAMEEHLGRTFQTPRLQYDDAREMEEFRGDEDAWLAGTGRTADGKAHISIDRAKELLAAQGLPQTLEPFIAPSLPPVPPLTLPTTVQRPR